MEQASARFAARDRWSTLATPAYPTDVGQTQLQRFIQSACDPANFEPNLALDLEIADLVNQKKGNAPREAAVAIVTLVNHRNQNVSLLALALLDICVKNCGYPFHLQISTKEFLNELVRRFPERPPLRPSRVQMKILEALEEWRMTICQTSRHKDDLGFIRDMHRLLQYKGYMFPEVRREDAAVLNEAETLKSAEEMEEEERAAQSAKLQELIRRGTPADLQEANQLMKVMAGYDTRNVTDYRAKAAEDIQKLREKANHLGEMMDRRISDGANAQDRESQNEAMEELAAALRNSQPKIRKMIQEEGEHDPEAVVKLLELNDMFNSVLEKWKLVSKGDLTSAQNLPAIAASAPTSSVSSRVQEISLIDFDSEPNGSANSQSTNAGKQTSIEDDLLGLSLDASPTFGQGGGITLGFGTNSSVPGPPLLSSTMQGNTFSPLQSIISTGSSNPTPNPNARQQILAAFSPTPPAVSTPSAMFPDFLGSKRAASPYSSTSGTSSPAPPFQSSVPTVNIASLRPQSSEGDDWTFASALPASSSPSLPERNELHLLTSPAPLSLKLEVTRGVVPNTVALKAILSSLSPSMISHIKIEMAVSRGYALKMETQSGTELSPFQTNGITQSIAIANVGSGDAKSVRLRWKTSYRIALGNVEEKTGEISGLGIS